MGYLSSISQASSKSSIICLVSVISFLLLLMISSVLSAATTTTQRRQVLSRTANNIAGPSSNKYAPPRTAKGHQVLYINRNTPFFYSKKQTPPQEAAAMAKKTKRKKIIVKNFKTSTSKAFSAMLPKGLVPPSGSSPCHNDSPKSVAFYCRHLTTTKP